MRHGLLALVMLAAGAVVAGLAQEAPARQEAIDPQPRGTFRTEINFVEVHAIVTDESGAFVRDLTSEDFEIYEDGVLQDTAAFSLIDVPVERPLVAAGATEPVEWDVVGATRGFDGRIYVLVLDDLHTAFARSQLVRTAARGFVEQYFGANDLAAVVYTSGRREAGQELTGSSRLLLAAIDRFQGRKLPSAGVERLAMHVREQGVDTGESEPIRSIEGLQRAEAVRDPHHLERGLNARRALDAVHNSAAWLEDVQGRRKALLFFSEGLDYDIYEPFQRGVGDSLLLDARRAIAAAQRANVAIYGIDPRGLSQFSGFVDVQAYSDYPQLEYGTFRGFLRELLLSQESLISLADQTGGLAIVNSGDVAGGLGRVVLDSSRYYLLGYYSDAANWSDRFLNIDVRVRRPGVRIRARQGFVPPDSKSASTSDSDPEPASARAAALGKPLPIGDLPLRVFAASFKGADGAKASVVVALEIDGRGLAFEERDGRYLGAVETSIVATDARARVQDGDDQSFDLRLLPDTHAWVRETGIRLLSRLDLPPGRYQIRVGARDAGDASALVPYDLEVPDYSGLPLGLSGLVLTSSEAESYVTANPDPELSGVLPGPPVVRRRFGPEETLTCFAEVYDSSTPSARQLDFVLTVRDAMTGRVTFTTRDRRAVEAGVRAATHGFTAEIPLADFRPGIFILRVEARSSPGRHAVHRELPFEVTGVSGSHGRR